MSRGNYIGGSWQQAQGPALVSLNPATQQPVWQGNNSSADDVAQAVNAAQAAFIKWKDRPLQERVAYIEAFKTLLQQKQKELVEIIAQDTGKVLWDSLGEVQAMIGKSALSADGYHTRTGYTEKEQAGVKQSLRHRPHGVLAVFGPYNFPGHLPNGHIMPALIAGNAVVFKPSEQTPLVAEYTAALWQEAGLPAGVLNMVQGGRETGEALAAHAGVDGLLFTGSAEVGALLHKHYGGQPGKMLALEMGGNNPLIVWEADDLKAAALVIIQSAFLTSGQRCTCARRLIVPQGSAGDAVLEALVEISRKITVGGYTDTPEPFMGPLISNREAEKILEAERQLEASGGKSLLKVRRPKDGLPFVTPGIVDVTPVKNRPDKEYFGPLLQVIRVPDFAAALKEANNTRFGLAAGLLSDKREHYEHFQREIRAGIVNWNRPTNGASSALPFGGVGDSGNHRPSAYYAADYCAYPVASQEADRVTLPAIPLPGISV